MNSKQKQKKTADKLKGAGRKGAQAQRQEEKGRASTDRQFPSGPPVSQARQMVRYCRSRSGSAGPKVTSGPQHLAQLALFRFFFSFPISVLFWS
jgi:hypothetical protein